MSDTTVKAETELQFPNLPAALTSRRRRLWQRCVLGLTGRMCHFGPTQTNSFGILTYHRVGDNVGPDPAMLNVSPSRFRKQLSGLLRLGYEPQPLQLFVEQQRQNQPFSKRSFAVVFDDGFADVYRNAWPVLRDLQIPATIFLATAYLDSRSKFPFDDWSQDTADTARPLSTAECREMYASGLIDLGTHTHSHQDFRNNSAALRCDLDVSCALLRTEFGIERPSFSFPYGFTSPNLANAAREAGTTCGLAADCQLVTQDNDPFAWGRFGATELDTAKSLAAKLDGWYSRCQNLWRSIRGSRG